MKGLCCIIRGRLHIIGTLCLQYQSQKINQKVKITCRRLDYFNTETDLVDGVKDVVLALNPF